MSPMPIVRLMEQEPLRFPSSRKPTGTISGTAEMCKGVPATLTMSFTGVAPFTFTYTDGTTPVTVVGNLTKCIYSCRIASCQHNLYSHIAYRR